MKPISRETIVDRRQPQMRWSAVIAGAVLSIGVWILLQTLGTGIGLSAVDADDPGSLRGVGIGTGIWTAIAPLIALFVGALLAGRLANTREARIGAIHGSVHWALSTIVGMWVVMMMIAAFASGASQFGTAAMRNERMTDRMSTRVNDEMETRNTAAMSERAKDRALRAADSAGKGLLIGGIGLLLGLGASLAGGALGARMSARRDGGVDDPRGGAYVPPTTEPVVPPTEPVVTTTTTRVDPLDIDPMSRR